MYGLDHHQLCYFSVGHGSVWMNVELIAIMLDGTRQRGSLVNVEAFLRQSWEREAIIAPLRPFSRALCVFSSITFFGLRGKPQL